MRPFSRGCSRCFWAKGLINKEGKKNDYLDGSTNIAEVRA